MSLPKKTATYFFKLWAKTYRIYIKLVGQEQEFFDCLEALDCLVDNILDAIEREDSSYQQVLSDTLEEVSSNPEAGKPIDVQGRDKWLEDLSDQAFTEV
ncbi:hypothetical protein QQ054_20275 [Oscillatoria amoena NRMC-F 0135]|nr:hypothetical protein [Oscillatoria amoena NRMC-F 0135]